MLSCAFNNCNKNFLLNFAFCLNFVPKCHIVAFLVICKFRAVLDSIEMYRANSS